jgi:acetyltransferase-like isoleucine patch superfamily enzyme
MLKLLEKAYSISNSRSRSIILKIIRKIEGDYFYGETSLRILKKYHNVEIGYCMFCFTDLTRTAQGTTFGNYCTISENTRIFNANHPSKCFTTHALLYNPIFGCTNEDVLPRTRLVIGHDVWIGYNSIILPSVNSIGNGAIIAAGAVVTKDVERYSIVGGNPAKFIAYRFTPEVIEKLEQSKWWLLSKEELIKNKEKYEKIVNFSIEDLKAQRNALLEKASR